MAALTLAEFASEVRSYAPEPLDDACVQALHAHYSLLLQWNETISLVGPRAVPDLLRSHYGEALAALPLLPRDADLTLVDVGSGAGFPGFVLAAARRELRSVLVEARERKWAFLKSAIAASGIRADCLLGTVDRTLPEGFPPRVDWLTLRAIKVPERAWRALVSRLTAGGRVLVWAGREEPLFPKSLLRVAGSFPLPASRSKRILELERA